MSQTVTTAERSTAAAPSSRRSLVGMVAAVAALHVLGWGVLLLVVVPQHFAIASGGVFTAALGVSAYLLGVRHAVDADHIAVIDNTTRKLVGEGRPAQTTGLWFSLGHSSVVLAAAVAIAAGARWVVDAVHDGDSTGATTLGVVGTIAAGAFLLFLTVTNVVTIVRLVRAQRAVRAGDVLDEEALERHLARRGTLAVLLTRLARRVSRPRHLYPVGLLMGLGFDTATQVALLVLAAGATSAGLPWYALVVLPVLFAAGMSLVDSADGALMARAYRWALVTPERKLRYNLVVTTVSVLAAGTIGVVVLAGLAAQTWGVTTGPVAAVAGIDLEYAGLALMGLLLAVWVAALVWWRAARRRA
ncbi:HoxN/HupN/NixA family nickel/cobalt transporter [Cellulomonas sp. PhB143]|uniref:HoxN/HupN/NixA family nickel/cobalt transporter n=1 Tax=Cellulomonas sp. PhB143 TaxID=2485186 RepID=UPI000F4AA657|nr:HoxN/HupN/NixA family nickel/cobalt transporter [Cellulomonas sp. PhB143]ROS78884.1 high-affinity nickel-transport protein [Cellulomonas sp. PhB143]